MPKTTTPQATGGTVPPQQRGGATEREFTVKERKQWQIILRRFMRHRMAMVSLVVLFLVVLFAYVGPHLWQFSPTVPTTDFRTGPTAQHPFGTDDAGFDYLARVMRGAQQSLKIAAIVAVLSTCIGAPYGAISGLIGGKVDAIMMRLGDLLLVLPLLVVAGALAVGHPGDTVLLVALILGLLGWPVNARQVRGVVLGLREQEFVEAARAMGAGTWRIVFRHLLPNATGTILVQATLDIAAAILAEAALSFLGLGVQAPDTSLGQLINQARNSVETLPWLFYIPGIVIILIALTINFIGDGLRDAFDPRQTRQRR
jgi:peptide/nickel transport system permease protein